MAFVLSFLVLSLWSSLFPPPRSGTRSEPQPIDNKEVKEIKEAQTLPEEGKEAVKSSQDNVSFEEKITTTETETFKLEFSNIGGNLRSIFLKKYKHLFLLNDIISLSKFGDKEFGLWEAKEDSIAYLYEDNAYQIKKQYQLDDNIIKSKIIIYNKNNLSNQNGINFKSFLINMSSLDKKYIDEHRTDLSLLEYSTYNKGNVFRKNNAFSFNPKENKAGLGNLSWTGFRDRYFCLIVKPLFDIENHDIRFIDDKHLEIAHTAKAPQDQYGDYSEFEHIIYAGPQEINLLKSYKLDFEKIVNFSGFGLFDAIAKLIYELIHFLHKIIPNWGVCIILIGFFIYFILYPLSLRSMLSMKKMQAVQPKIAKLQEQYKNNPQKLNKEIMELYKTEKVNPLGGCLPVLLQMPVFIGLYQVLWRSVSLKGADFLWIKDLAEPDRLFIFPTALPIIGNEFNILPIIMAIVMFFQQKMSSASMVSTDQAQETQKKIMQIFFPIFLGFIFYKFSSGLNLYFTVFYLLSAIMQWKTMLPAKTS